MSQSVHDHPAAEERQAGPSGDGTVIIEVGDDLGAAVIYTDASLAGAEIEIRRDGQEWHGTHTAVRPRRFAGRSTFAAVFGSLPSGSYDLRVRPAGAHGPVVHLDVVAGGVVEITWGPVP